MKTCLIVTALLAAGVSQSAFAIPLTEVSIVNRSTGERLPTYEHRGQLWVAGKPGDRYAIELRNRTGERVLTVISVDGVNVLSGETAASNQRGYVLSPGSTAEIAGWRKSNQEVASFYFTALPDSYAARTDRPANVGVIGIAAFREFREPAPVMQEAPVTLHKREAADSAARAAAPAPLTGAAAESLSANQPSSAPQKSAKLGTGHGERLYAPTYQVDFHKATPDPEEVITIRYDSYRNLLAMGIIPAQRRPAGNPRAFPGDGFVPDPS